MLPDRLPVPCGRWATHGVCTVHACGATAAHSPHRALTLPALTRGGGWGPRTLSGAGGKTRGHSRAQPRPTRSAQVAAAVRSAAAAATPATRLVAPPRTRLRRRPEPELPPPNQSRPSRPAPPAMHHRVKPVRPAPSGAQTLPQRSTLCVRHLQRRASDDSWWCGEETCHRAREAHRAHPQGRPMQLGESV